jgi:hypothetical protein
MPRVDPLQVLRPPRHPLLIRQVTAVLAELVSVSASDRKSRIRRAVLHALTPQLDPYLAKVCSLHACPNGVGRGRAEHISLFVRQR